MVYSLTNIGKPRVQKDIDVDLPSSLKRKIIQALAEDFKTFGAELTNIAAFGTEKSKAAIITAARGLGYSSEDALYIASLIPSDRGFLRSLHDCYHGNPAKGFEPVKDFVEEMKQFSDLWDVAQRIEGLISRSSVHPAGIAIFNNDTLFSHCATFVAPGGQRVIQFDLADAEKVGILKYDLLATDATDAIQTELMLLAQDGYIEWDTNLKTTYNNYLHPEVINYTDSEMWALANQKKIISLFQMDSPVGESAIEDIQPDSLFE
jgi:DNA polymerase-3 subunit alpha